METKQAEATRFLLALVGSVRNICFQTFADSKECNSRPVYRYRDLNDAHDGLTKMNKKGNGIYFLVNEGDGEGRRKENIKSIRAIFVDLDGAPLEPVMSYSIPPHIVTQTSPGRYQAFWKVEGVPVERFTDVQKRLVELFNGDPSIIDPSRVMRLPGYFHMKRDPFRSEIVHIDSTAKPLCYQEVIDGFGVPKMSEKPIFLESQTQERIPEGKRNQTMIAVSARLRNAGLEGERLYEALMKENTARCSPALPEREIRRIAKWAKRLDASEIKPAREEEFKNIRMMNKAHSYIKSWKDIMEMQLPPARWIIKDLLPEGLTILAGRPKHGKSWLALQMCFSIATGNKFAHYFQVNKGSTLCIALEDNYRRLQGRINVVSNGCGLPDQADITIEWPRLPNAIQPIMEWAEEQRALGKPPRLVVIDTLQKIRSTDQGRNGDVYGRDYNDVGSLQKLAAKLGIAIIVIHHLRKADGDDEYDQVSGSAGITGAADSVFILSRPSRAEAKAELLVSGRDIQDNTYKMTLDISNGGWECLGNHDDEFLRVTNEVLKKLNDIGTPIKPSDIAKEIGKNSSYVQKCINYLVEDGFAVRAAGHTGKYLPAPTSH